MSEDKDHATILVVDDIENNRLLLEDILSFQGFRVATAATGEEALAQLEMETIDLVLLDVQMPGIDGYEVCRRIRADPNHSTLPVIMVTALDGVDHQILGLDAGANDYVNKPLQRDTLLARIRTQLRASRLHKRSAAYLERKNSELSTQQERQVELTNMVVHDMKSPLAALNLSLEMLEGSVDATDVRRQRTLSRMTECTERLTSMVENMLQVQQMDSGGIRLEPRHFRFDALLDVGLAHLRGIAEPDGIRLTVQVAPEANNFYGDLERISRVIDNLLTNALRFAPDDSEIHLEITTHGKNEVMVTVGDRGPGVPEELRKQIFEKFTTSEEASAALAAAAVKKQLPKHSKGRAPAVSRWKRVGRQEQIGERF